MTRFIPAQSCDALPSLLTAYYREGEDADTPQETLDAFISLLGGLLARGVLWGSVLLEDHVPAGFVLYAKDGDDYPFSECPGMGTIAEIGVTPGRRRQGLGRLLVRHAEERLSPSCRQMYVCAHDPARAFWASQGYLPTGRTAGNGLPLYVKSI